MILLIDNYDSFTYNLVQYFGTLQPDISVVRNDGISVEEIEKMNPSHIVLSPGPGYPKDAGICEEIIRHFQGKIPILGICLGHQAVCEVYGGTIAPAKALVHGKKSKIRINKTCTLFRGLKEEFYAARYHSLALKEETSSKRPGGDSKVRGWRNHGSCTQILSGIRTSISSGIHFDRIWHGHTGKFPVRNMQ